MLIPRTGTRWRSRMIVRERFYKHSPFPHCSPPPSATCFPISWRIAWQNNTGNHCIPIEMAKIRKMDKTKWQWGCGKTGILILLVGMQNGRPTFWELSISHMMTQFLPLWSGKSTPRRNPREMKTYDPHKDL